MNNNNADSNELTMHNHIKRLARGIKMVLDSMRIQPIDNVISELNTLNTFVKVKGNSFDIGKTLFSFVEFDKNTKKLQKSVDCYMGMEESLIFCHDILSGKLPKLAAKEKAKGEQYPKAVWHSPLGGVNEQKARERKLRSDGKAISRSKGGFRCDCHAGSRQIAAERYHHAGRKAGGDHPRRLFSR